MHRPRPSAETLSAVLSAIDRKITIAALPVGEAPALVGQRLGADVSQLLLIFEDRSSLHLWPEMHRFGEKPWHEAFVLHAQMYGESSSPLGLANAGAPQGFAECVALEDTFKAASIHATELFVDLGASYLTDDQDYLTSDSLRLQLDSANVEVSTEGRSLPLWLNLRVVPLLR